MRKLHDEQISVYEDVIVSNTDNNADNTGRFKAQKHREDGIMTRKSPRCCTPSI